METLHAVIAPPRLLGTEDLLAVLDRAGPSIVAEQPSENEIVLYDGPDRERRALLYTAPVFGKPDVEGDPFTTGAAYLELMGHPLFALRVARAFADLTGARVAMSGPPEEGGPWHRRPAVRDDRLMAVEVPRPVLEASPWVLAQVKRASREGRRLVLRTPPETRVSPGMRRILRLGWADWVREERVGSLQGISGRRYSWPRRGAEAREAPVGLADDDLATLRVQMLHPRGPEAEVGALMTRVAEHLGVSASAAYGWTEPVPEPWDRDGFAGLWRERGQWLLMFVDSPAFAGTLVLQDTPAGVVEDLDLEVPPDVDPATVWADIRDLRPLTMTHRRAGDGATVLLRADLADRLGGAGTPLADGTYRVVGDPEVAERALRRPRRGPQATPRSGFPTDPNGSNRFR